MNPHAIAQQVDHIVRQVAALEEVLSVSVVSKRFPRLGPAEAGTGYHEEVSRFVPAEIPPPPLQFREGTDEVVVTINGKLRAPDRTRHLVEKMSDVLGAAGFTDDWEFRAGVVSGGVENSFELTVFTNFFGQRARQAAD